MHQDGAAAGRFGAGGAAPPGGEARGDGAEAGPASQKAPNSEVGTDSLFGLAHFMWLERVCFSGRKAISPIPNNTGPDLICA